jgi:hypothetical protein
MRDPNEAARADEAEIERLTRAWLKARPTATTVQRSRAPTLFERYRDSGHPNSFGDWLETQGFPCA